MRVFVYEFVSGGGMWSLLGGSPPSGSLLAEGTAMTAAITADFAALPDVEVWTTRDSRLPPLHDSRCLVELIQSAEDELSSLTRLAAAADWTLLVAPESDGILCDRALCVLQSGGRLLSPGPEVVRLASEKQRTAEHFAQGGIRVPKGRVIHPGEQAPEALFPAIIKPLDGCGSQGVRLVANLEELHRLQIDRLMRLETYISGSPASVAVLCGPGGPVALPACEQYLSCDGQFTYLGGRTPLSPALDERARELALSALRSIPGTIGYIGIDLVLGVDRYGDDDFVIEINPRLTTSYVGLRATCRENLAAAMLAVAGGERPALSWAKGGVQYSADGRITNLPEDCTP